MAGSERNANAVAVSFWGVPRKGILHVQQGHLDVPYLRHWSAEMLEPPAVRELDELIATYEAADPPALSGSHPGWIKDGGRLTGRGFSHKTWIGIWGGWHRLDGPPRRAAYQPGHAGGRAFDRANLPFSPDQSGPESAGAGSSGSPAASVFAVTNTGSAAAGCAP